MAGPPFQLEQRNRAGVGNWLLGLTLLSIALVGSVVSAKDWSVRDPDAFRAALRGARNGDQILLDPGIYRGTFHASGLGGVTIRSSDPNNPAVIDATGAGEGLKLSQADRVTIADLIIEHADANGINIDDGGFQRLSTRLVIRRVIVRRGGGHAIKFAGVDGFLIDSVTLEDWGNGHAGFNLIGAHNGIVQHSVVRRTDTSGGFGLKVEGGSTNVAIRANRFENAGERAIQFGGVVGLDPFRTRTTEGATAERVAAEGNVIVSNGADGEGIRSAVAFIGARDAEFRFNLVFRPAVFVGRVLREGSHPAAADAHGRVFRNNVIVWYEGDFSPAHAFNVGAETFPEALEFRANRWVNLSPHGASEVLLPTKEQEPSYGFDPGFRPDQPISWEFEWGQWIVNATTERQTHRINSEDPLNVASPGRRAQFAPTFARPLVGDWTFRPLSADEIDVPSMSAVILVKDATREAASEVR
jgi:hypothetical protein